MTDHLTCPLRPQEMHLRVEADGTLEILRAATEKPALGGGIVRLEKWETIGALGEGEL